MATEELRPFERIERPRRVRSERQLGAREVAHRPQQRERELVARALVVRLDEEARWLDVDTAEHVKARLFTARVDRLRVTYTFTARSFARLIGIAEIMLTDSGGVQEEAPALGKPVLVMRETTERPEGVEAGTARLVGTDSARIVSEIFTLLDDNTAYSAMARAHNPFGDGKASQRIAEIIWNASRQKT